MRILQINANYGLGSTGLIMKDIGNIIIQSGNEAYFAFQRCSDRPINGITIGNVFDWKLHAFLCRLFGSQGFYSRIATKRFLKQLDRIKPDIVHIHNLHSNYINLEFLSEYLANNNIATVITMHDCWFFTGKCFHYIDCHCDKFTTGCGSCPKKSAPPMSVFWDNSSRDWTRKNYLLHKIPRLAVVGCSKWICMEAEKGFLKDFKLANIYNGVDIEIFKPKLSDLRTKLSINSDDFVILGMANKWLQKRNRAAMERISSYANAVIVLIGCSELEVKDLSTEYKNVIPVGFINCREELAEYYCMADVFVNLTHADTLPTVNMESICCGTPVITYDVSGSPELVIPGTGLVVSEDDIDGLIKAIDTVRYEDFGECGNIGKMHFDKNVCYSQYMDVYNNLV